MRDSHAARSRIFASVLCVSLALAGCANPHHSKSSALEKGALSTDSDQRLADSALQSGNLEMAVSLYTKILTRAPNNQPALVGLGNALFQSNELQQAHQVYLQLESVAPQQRDAELGLARISVREHKLDDAVERYQAMLKRSPDLLAAQAGLGVALDLQGRHPQAQAVYRQALLAHPDDMGLKNDLGLSLVLSHQLRAGIAELLSIVDSPSAPSQTRQNLALGYGLLGNTDAATRVLQSEMSPAQVQSNLQYYQVLRARLTQPGTLSGTIDQP